MTTWYCDYQFGFQGVLRVWAAGTVHAVNPGTFWATTLAEAITLAEDGDTIKVSAGTYTLPNTIDKTLLIASTGVVTFERTPPAPLVDVNLDPYCIIALNKVVRFKGGDVTGAMGVKGSLVLDGQAIPASGKIFDEGAIVAIGPSIHAFYQDMEGSYERYDAYFQEGRWPSQFGVSNYRNAATLEAPAKFRDVSGQQKTRWVPIAPFRYLLRDGAGSEQTAGSVDIATQGSTFFTKPGLPAHQDMRVVSRGRIFNIVAVSRPSGPGQDLRLTVTEYTGM